MAGLRVACFAEVKVLRRCKRVWLVEAFAEGEGEVKAQVFTRSHLIVKELHTVWSST